MSLTDDEDDEDDDGAVTMMIRMMMMTTMFCDNALIRDDRVCNIIQGMSIR